MKKFVASLSLACCLLGSQTALASLFEVNIDGLVTTNQSDIFGNCGAGGFSACPYFPLNSSVSMSFTFDDSTPSSPTPSGTAAYYKNALSSLTFSIDAIGYTGSATGSFGQIFVSNDSTDRISIHAWESTQTIFSPTSISGANAMDLTTLDTTLANPTDNIYGDIEINAIRINLASLTNTVFSSFALPISFNSADFNDPNNTNWGVNIRSSSGWGGSAGMSITGLSINNLSNNQNTSPSNIPVPGTLFMTLTGLALVCRKQFSKTFS